eukprot:scaffold254244_cov48-Prasinocladus_malaysianus.AAC.1
MASDASYRKVRPTRHPPRPSSTQLRRLSPSNWHTSAQKRSTCLPRENPKALPLQQYQCVPFSS